MKIKPMNGMVYISTNKREKETFTYGSLTLFKETKFEKYDPSNCVQHGIVAAVPEYLDKKGLKKTDIEVGDKVYCHHFLTDSDNEKVIDGEVFYNFEYDAIYCKIKDGKPIMLRDFIFITPIEESEDDLKFDKDSLIIKKIHREDKQLQGIIHAAPKGAEDLGLKEGDKVLYMPNIENQITVEGVDCYQMELDDMLLKIPEGAEVKAKVEDNYKSKVY
jgi:co-chaperonin GroES (HSP10)